MLPRFPSNSSRLNFGILPFSKYEAVLRVARVDLFFTINYHSHISFKNQICFYYKKDRSVLYFSKNEGKKEKKTPLANPIFLIDSLLALVLFLPRVFLFLSF